MSNLSEAHRYNGIVHKSAHTKIKTIKICWAFGILSCAYKHNQFEFKECHNNRNLRHSLFRRYPYLTMNCQYFGNLLINSMKCIHLRRIHTSRKKLIQMRKNRTFNWFYVARHLIFLGTCKISNLILNGLFEVLSRIDFFLFAIDWILWIKEEIHFYKSKEKNMLRNFECGKMKLLWVGRAK